MNTSYLILTQRYFQLIYKFAHTEGTTYLIVELKHFALVKE